MGLLYAPGAVTGCLKYISVTSNDLLKVQANFAGVLFTHKPSKLLIKSNNYVATGNTQISP